MGKLLPAQNNHCHYCVYCEVIVNLTKEANRRIDVSIKFGSPIDYGKVVQAMETTVKSFAPDLKEPPSRIGIEKVEADGFTVTLNVWVKSHGFYDAESLLNEKLIIALRPLIQDAP